MATLRKRNDKWHVQIRRKDYPSQTKSFISKKTAEKWIRETENRIDKGYLHQSSEKLSLTLKELIIRYIANVLVKKRGCVNETIILKAFMRQPFVNKPLIQIRGEDFAQYRDQRLEYVKPATLLRELCIVQHLYSTAKKEWSFDIPNPIKNIQKPKLNNRRERRLTKEEYEFLITDNNHITKKKWKKIKPKLTPFFNLEENTFRQMRLEKTWETAEERVKKSKEAADIRWAKEKESVQSIISKTAKAWLWL